MACKSSFVSKQCRIDNYLLREIYIMRWLFIQSNHILIPTIYMVYLVLFLYRNRILKKLKKKCGYVNSSVRKMRNIIKVKGQNKFIQLNLENEIRRVYRKPKRLQMTINGVSISPPPHSTVVGDGGVWRRIPFSGRRNTMLVSSFKDNERQLWSCPPNFYQFILERNLPGITWGYLLRKYRNKVDK